MSTSIGSAEWTTATLWWPMAWCALVAIDVTK